MPDGQSKPDAWQAILGGVMAQVGGVVEQAAVKAKKTVDNIDTKAIGENIHSAVNEAVGETEKVLQNVDIKAVIDGAGAGIAFAAQNAGNELSKIDLQPALAEVHKHATAAHEGFNSLDPTAQRAIIGVGATVAGLALAPVVICAPLSMLGFSPTGPVAGSVAAGMQSGIGNVAAGSAFATAQSLAMNGAAASVANHLVASGLTVALYAAGQGLVKEGRIPDTVGEEEKKDNVSSRL